jgi:hypothetical protein
MKELNILYFFLEKYFYYLYSFAWSGYSCLSDKHSQSVFLKSNPSYGSLMISYGEHIVFISLIFSIKNAYMTLNLAHIFSAAEYSLRTYLLQQDIYYVLLINVFSLTEKSFILSTTQVYVARVQTLPKRPKRSNPPLYI